MISFTGGGAFATSRRCVSDYYYIQELKRQNPRASMQTLAQMAGCHVDTVKAAMGAMLPDRPVPKDKSTEASKAGRRTDQGIENSRVMLGHLKNAAEEHFGQFWLDIARPLDRSEEALHMRACIISASRAAGVSMAHMQRATGICHATMASIASSYDTEAVNIDKAELLRLTYGLKDAEERKGNGPRLARRSGL